MGEPLRLHGPWTWVHGPNLNTKVKRSDLGDSETRGP
jgi:hypothetical protein